MGIDLGFVEPAQPNELFNIHFPSKIGGRPAWLDLANVPSPEALLCPSCSEPRVFLFQLYASLDTEEAFHRTIFMFICRQESCNRENLNENLLVFRNQIARRNPYYDYDPVPEDVQCQEVVPPFKRCAVCGCRGPFNCARCKNVNYCSKSHQTSHWKAGHKNNCGLESTENMMTDCKDEILLPEFELVLEEEVPEEKPDISVEELEREQMEKLAEAQQLASMQSIPEDELRQYTETEDEYFSNFKKRTAENPDQVMRYERGGEPLWIAGTNTIGSASVPKCEQCGGERQFEFQIMPQLLGYLKCDTVDWGVLSVYTCKASCGTDGKYYKEYVHKQDIVVENKEE